MAAAGCPGDIPAFAAWLGIDKVKTVYAWQEEGRRPNLDIILECLVTKLPDVDLHYILTGATSTASARNERDLVVLRENILRLEGKLELLQEQLRASNHLHIPSPAGANTNTGFGPHEPVSRRELREYVQGELSKLQAKEGLWSHDGDRPSNTMPVANQKTKR